jgi:hypothetical protein
MNTPRPDAREAAAKSLRGLRWTAWVLLLGGAGGWVQVHAIAVAHGHPFWSVAPEASGWLGMAAAGAIGLCAAGCLKVLAARISDMEDRLALAETWRNPK